MVLILCMGYSGREGGVAYNLQRGSAMECKRSAEYPPRNVWVVDLEKRFALQWFSLPIVNLFISVRGFGQGSDFTGAGPKPPPCLYHKISNVSFASLLLLYPAYRLYQHWPTPSSPHCHSKQQHSRPCLHEHFPVFQLPCPPARPMHIATHLHSHSQRRSLRDQGMSGCGSLYWCGFCRIVTSVRCLCP